MTRKLFALTLFALILSAGAALADDATPAPEPAATAAEQCQPADLAKSTLDPRGSAQEVSSFCSVDCGTTTISVNCNGNCGAIDRNCAFGQRGRVTCNGTTTSVCPDPCPVVCPETHCPDGTILQCPPGTSDCQGGGGLCFVQCDGAFQWCPGHVGKFRCDF